jgi:phospholipase C
MQLKNPGSGLTRRQLLSTTARAAAAAFASAFLPSNVRRALATPMRRGSFADIKHVVLLMQENRSFDHYFGMMSGVRGFSDPSAIVLPNGKSIFHQPDAENPQGHILPFHLDTQKTGAQKIPSTSHAWAVQHEVWNHGKMDAWLPAHRKADGAKGSYTMGYHTRADIPFHYALAESFTICDEYFCSVFGPTWPNRLYWMTGMLDPEGRQGGPILVNKIPNEGLKWTTYAERLERAGVSWKVYQQQDNYNTNAFEFFKVFREAAPGSPLYQKAMVRGTEGQFEYDAMHDRLPAVSWILPTRIQSEHPDYTPAEGAAFIASKLDAIAANPDVWAKTAFILNYDENDGLFDHVPPPTPPDDTPAEFVQGLPVGGGFRVPCIIVSPWTAGGWVCGQKFDHTSVLRFLEKFTNVREPNISEWRRKTFGDLTSAFRFDSTAPPPTLPDTNGHLSMSRRETAPLPAPVFDASETQALPAQEKGKRRRI